MNYHQSIKLKTFLKIKIIFFKKYFIKILYNKKNIIKKVYIFIFIISLNI